MKKLFALTLLVGTSVMAPAAFAAADAPAAAVVAAIPPHEAFILCPPMLRHVPVIEDLHAKAWKLGGPKQAAPLKDGRIFIGKPTEDALTPEAEVKPIPHLDKAKEEFVQIWQFSDQQRGHMVLVCDYSGTDNFLMRALDASVSQCASHDPLDREKGQIAIGCQ